MSLCNERVWKSRKSSQPILTGWKSKHFLFSSFFLLPFQSAPADAHRPSGVCNARHMTTKKDNTSAQTRQLQAIQLHSSGMWKELSEESRPEATPGERSWIVIFSSLFLQPPPNKLSRKLWKSLAFFFVTDDASLWVKGDEFSLTSFQLCWEGLDGKQRVWKVYSRMRRKTGNVKQFQDVFSISFEMIISFTRH